MAVAKHFPGLGRVDRDPHFHLPRILVDKREIEEVNLPPFRKAIEEGVSALMRSHAIYPAIDNDRPATMSRDVLTHLIRDEMAFKGLIITDDLEMGAIAKQWGVVKGASAAFEAGADILLICENQINILESIDHIKKRVSTTHICLQRLIQSNERVLQAKKRYLIPGQEISIPAVASYFGPYQGLGDLI